MSRIAEVRRAKGMTQEELARAVGVALRSLTAYEAGATEPPVTRALAIAEALGVDVNELGFERR